MSSVNQHPNQVNPKMPRFLCCSMSSSWEGQFSFGGVHPVDSDREKFVRMMVGVWSAARIGSSFLPAKKKVFLDTISVLFFLQLSHYLVQQCWTKKHKCLTQCQMKHVITFNKRFGERMWFLSCCCCYVLPFRKIFAKSWPCSKTRQKSYFFYGNWLDDTCLTHAIWPFRRSSNAAFFVGFVVPLISSLRLQQVSHLLKRFSYTNTRQRIEAFHCFFSIKKNSLQIPQGGGGDRVLHKGGN